MKDSTAINYLVDLLTIIKQDALEMKKELANKKDPSNFEKGILQGYSEVLELAREQAITFDIPLEDIGLNNFDPENDL